MNFDILSFIYKLLNKGIKTWAENHNIQLFVQDGILLTEYEKDFIKKHKKEIFQYLSNNNILSKEVKTVILKAGTNKGPLSFAQERFRFIEKYEGGTYAYNMPMLFKLSNLIDINILEKSIKSIVDRHEILRTVIRENANGESYQEVLDIPQEIKQIISNSIEEFEQKLDIEVDYIFDLSREYPIKVNIHYVGAEKYLSIVIHHIAFDGWSLDIFLRELLEYYKYYANMQYNLSLKELPIQYKDFALWQKNYLTEELLAEKLKYWRDKLDNYEQLNLVTDIPRPEHINYRGKYINFELGKELSDKIRNISQELGVSLYSVLLSAYYLMLRVYSNQNDIVIGTPAANRHYHQITNVIGLFINSLALRIEIDPHMTIKNFIKLVSHEVKEAQMHQDLPFEKLVDELKIPKDSTRHPIFQVLFSIENFGNVIKQNRHVDDLDSILEPWDSSIGIHKTAKFDISTFIDDSQDILRGTFNYATSLYKAKTIRRFIQTYVQILQCIADSIDNKPSQQFRIKEMQYLSVEERETILYKWNETDKDYYTNKRVTDVFEEQVATQPDSIAVVYLDIRLTYQELNARANKLANYLLTNYQLKPDTFVSLCLDRSEQMLIVILAVLKVGAAYVPIDPSFPDDRISYCLNDTGSKLIISNRIYQQRLNNITEIPVIAIDDQNFKHQLLGQPADTPKVTNTSRNLAYIIYTSGTTGNPKGVMIEHRGLINMALAQGKEYALEKPYNKRNFLWFANYVFDCHASEIYTSILNGDATYIVDNDTKQDIKLLAKYLKSNAIDVAMIPPALLNNVELLQSTILVVAGDKTNPQILDFYLKNNIRVVNAYGPSEVSVCTSLNHFKNNGASNIGRPLSNLKYYILDPYLNPLPIGAIGELYIAGIGLGRGYLNKPDLSATRFIANPFQTRQERNRNENSRLYRTGDLARFLENGDIDYIGRNDFQIKIRGYRIELGEIENVLSNYDKITQSAVIINENKPKGSKYLIGYYTSAKRLDEEDILRYVASKLPAYMIPNVLVWLEKLPLTINGKLDRKALPKPEFKGREGYIEPRNELEAKTCGIWAEVLGVDKVGIRDDFFRLGGDSILSIQLVSRLRQVLGLHVSIKNLFIYKNIEKLFDNVIGKDIVVVAKTEQGLLSGDVGLLAIQQWFFDSQFSAPNHWNQSFMIKTPSLDVEKLQISIKKLVEQHDSFRLKFRKEGSKYKQYYDQEAIPEQLKVLDVRSLKAKNDSPEFFCKLDQILTQWQSNFDLEQGPLYVIGYLHGYQDGSCRVYFALHHLLVDVISWWILIEDLQSLYQDKELDNKGSSYRQWVNAVDNYAKTHLKEQEYWQQVLDDYDTRMLDGFISQNIEFVEMTLDSKQTSLLLTESNKVYNTQINDLLLTALGLALVNITQSKVNYITLEGHGREEIDPEINISKTVGWFTTMYPVRLEIIDDIGSSIKKIKEGLRQIPNRGIGYGAIYGYDNAILPKICFNYLGQFDKEGVSTWSISNESSGTSIHPSNIDLNALNISGFVVDGKLQFHISSKLKNTDELVTNFKQKLLEIIAHTLQTRRSYLTVSDIDNIISWKFLDKIQQEKEVTSVYLANSLQQGFIYHALNQGEVDDAYRVQLIWEYHTELDIAKLKQAWEYTQNRYAALRLRFAWEEEPVQIIDKEAELDFRYIDLSNLANSKDRIRELQLQDRLEVYQLDQGKLFRVYIIKQSNNLYTCLFSNHHAILDGWSSPILLEYMHDTYLKLLDNKPVIIAADESYQMAQRYLQIRQHDNQEYWQQYINQIKEKADLSSLLNDNQKHIKLNEYKHILEPANQILEIKEDLYKNLKELARAEGLTLSTIVQYVWHKVLSIFGNSNQTTLGITVSGRNMPITGIENSVGLYINTLPIVVNHNQPSCSLIKEIKNLQNNINEINSRSNISLARLQKSGERLFYSLFIYENYPVQVNDTLETKIKIQFKEGIEKLDYPISVLAYEADNNLIFKINYASELFSQDVIGNLLIVVQNLLEQIVSDRNKQLGNISYLTHEQYKKIGEGWNETGREYKGGKTIHKLFEEQVAKTPDSIALIYGDLQLTYGVLNEGANKLAHYISNQHKIKPDTLIALCLERSEQMLISILAILKAGAAYVPIDPSYPDERIKYIINDAKIKVLLTDDKNRARLTQIAEASNTCVIAIDAIQAELLAESSSDLDTTTKDKHLAYVIYTSGTTGNPKGVMVEHQAYIATINAMVSAYFSALERIKTFSVTNYVFDIFGLEYGAPLLTGGCVHFSNSDFNSLNCKDYDFIQMTPSLCRIKLDNLVNVAATNLLIGGEKLTKELLQQLLLKNANIFNVYGPTETTIWSTANYLQHNNNASDIGLPLDNEKAYVLDQYLNPLPIGAVGELYLAGLGLARGYLDKPDLTAEKFIANPFNAGSRLYKTGDLVKQVPNGHIEYIGRYDSQIKFNGYRIELNEIESALASYPQVKHAVVLLKELSDTNQQAQQDKYPIAYYVADKPLEHSLIFAHLANKLPQYMIPRSLLHLTALPLNHNGKLDTNSLPLPETDDSTSFVAPCNPLELKLATIWSHILNIPISSISIFHDFFALGGNSILAIKLVAALNRENYTLKVADIFIHRNINNLVARMRSKKDHKSLIIKLNNLN